jgi:hypothetical protein
MIVKPDDQVLDYLIYQTRIGKAEREKRFIDFLSVLDRRGGEPGQFYHLPVWALCEDCKQRRRIMERKTP